MSNFLDMKIKGWENEDAEKGVFIGLANKRWFKDHVGDITTDNAFTASIKRHKEKNTMPKLLLQHKPDQVVGVFLDVWEDADGLWCKGQLCLETVLGRETHALMKQGAYDELSIGYITKKEVYDPKTKSNYLDEVDIKEISIVTWACNSESKITTVKSDEVEVKSETVQEEIVVQETDINISVSNEEQEKADELNELSAKLDAFILSSKINAFLKRV